MPQKLQYFNNLLVHYMATDGRTNFTVDLIEMKLAGLREVENTSFENCFLSSSSVVGSLKHTVMTLYEEGTDDIEWNTRGGTRVPRNYEDLIVKLNKNSLVLQREVNQNSLSGSL